MAKIDIYNLKDVPKSEIPKEGHKAYELYFDIINDFGEPDEWLDDEEVRDVAQPVFDLIDILNELNKQTKTKTKSKSTKTKAKSKTKTESKAKAEKQEKKQAKKKTGSNKKSSKKSKSKSKAKQVEHTDPQISILKSFYLLTNKPVPQRRVLSLYRKIERLATEKIIRKKDKYASEIEQISEILADAYNTGKDPITITVPDDERQRLKEIAYSQKVRESVRIIKAFLTFLTDQTPHRAEKLLTRIENAFEKEKIKKSDPYLDEVKDIQNLLEKFLDKGKEIKLSQTQLQGLGQII